MTNPISSFHGASVQPFSNPYAYPIETNEERGKPVVESPGAAMTNLDEFFDLLKQDRIEKAVAYLNGQFRQFVWQPFLDQLIELVLHVGCKEKFLLALSLSTGFADEISRSIVDAYKSNEEQKLYRILKVLHGHFIKLGGLSILEKFFETPRIWNHLPLALRERMKRQPIHEVLCRLQSLTDREVRLNSVSDALWSGSKSDLDRFVSSYLQDGEWLSRFEEIVCMAKNTLCGGELLAYFQSHESQIYTALYNLAQSANGRENHKFESILMAQFQRLDAAFESIGGHEFFIKFFKDFSIIRLLGQGFIDNFLERYKAPSMAEPELMYTRLYLLISGIKHGHCFNSMPTALRKMINSEKWLGTLNRIIVYAKAKNRLDACRQLFNYANILIQNRLYNELKLIASVHDSARTQQMCFEERIRLLLALDAVYTSIGMPDYVSSLIKEKSFRDFLPPVFHISNESVCGEDVLKSLEQVQKRVEELGVRLFQNAVVGQKEKFKVYSVKRVWKIEVIHLARGVSLYIKGYCLGEGTFKTVTKLIPLSDALKVVEAKQNYAEPIYRESFLKEAFISSVFQKKNVQHVVKLFEMYIYRNRARLLMEELDGEITDIVQVLPDTRARLTLCKQLVDAVRGIHASGYGHFDLKMANILYKRISPAQFDIRIGDLGSVQKIDATMKLCSTYPAPEIMDRFFQKPGTAIKYNKEQDYWNIGDMLYFLNYGISPLCALRLSFNQNKISYNEKLEILERDYLKRLRVSKKPIDRSIAGLFSRDPMLRPNLQEVHDAIVKTME